MPSKEREYRSMSLNIESREEGSEPSFFVEGYASTFDPYVLFERDGIKYSERIARDAFAGADMTDVVFRIDHEGKVYARTSAGSLELSVDDGGLKNRANLGLTAKSRELYEDIAAGNYLQMSFAFTVAEEHIEKDTMTRVIDRIEKVYDVSPVSFPANPKTSLSVSTRSLFDGAIEERKEAERLRLEREREILKLKLRLFMED